uniref:Uncharacterized protein n=1 Tax=Aegilops tauschii TaxID=37682 RepID=R7WAV4_AEGTA
MEFDKRTGTPSPLLPRSASTVTYCCGRCGYDLKLSSSARDTAGRCVAQREDEDENEKGENEKAT